MHSFEVHSNERTCRKSGRLGLEQVLNNPPYLLPQYDHWVSYPDFFYLCRRDYEYRAMMLRLQRAGIIPKKYILENEVSEALKAIIQDEYKMQI